MSLYNAMFGINPMAETLVRILDLDVPVLSVEGKFSVGRFRDVFIRNDPNDPLRITLLTRNGRGTGQDAANHELRRHPNYFADFEDDFDSTYQYFVFEVPEDYSDFCRKHCPSGPIPSLRVQLDQKTKEMQGMTVGSGRPPGPGSG